MTDRIVAGVDGLQRRHRVLAFGWAVGRKYADDTGGREAALITYYGFLSVFPILLLAVTAVSWVLAENEDLRHQLVAAMVPATLQPSVEQAAAALPRSPVALVIGLLGLLYTATGVVGSAYRTVNRVAAVPFDRRSGIVSRIARIVVALIVVLAGTVGVGAGTVAATALPGLELGSRALAALGSALIVFAVLLAGARLLLDRPAPLRALWPAALTGALAVTLVLSTGAVVLPELIRRAGVVYGGFATVAGLFALLSLLSQALVFAAEIAAVRYAGLWPRALDPDRPTAADIRARALLVGALVPPSPSSACAAVADSARPERR